MSSVSKPAIRRSLPVGCCLIPSSAEKDFRESRLIHIQQGPPGQEVAWLVELESRKLPTSRPLSELVNMVAEGLLTVQSWTPRISSSIHSSVGLKHLEYAEAAWNRIAPLTGEKMLPKMLNDQQRGKLIEKRLKDTNCHRNQLYRDWSKYLRHGMTSDALNPCITKLFLPPWKPRRKRKSPSLRTRP